MNAKIQGIAVAVILAAIVASMTLFVVDERRYALVRQFGEVRYAVKKPGLYMKWPFIQNVIYFDKRVQTIDGQEPERFLTAEKKNVLVDSYVKWRIVDPWLYYISVGGDETRASIRLSQTINDGLRAEFGKGTVGDVISRFASSEKEDASASSKKETAPKREIMKEMRGKANEDAKKIGVEVLDVRVKRVELPTEVADDVYRRMEAERKQVASQLRAEGEREAEKIRAEADRTRAVTLANAYKEAQGIKGKGDADAAAIYARAFNQNPEFYAFYRSMLAYQNSFKTKQDILLLEPNSDFFKYLKNAQ
ncbi:MAG: protease modulator HflC [Zoogloeaceae bacterium]|jgi:membrane protease subunit HflC|nr:protease modulator HflC [Zoogloeaceae bacterium]